MPKAIELKDVMYAGLLWKLDTLCRSKNELPDRGCWSASVGGLRITVLNNHLYHEGKWVAHCHDMFSDRELKAETIKDAMAEALLVVFAKVQPMYQELRKCVAKIPKRKEKQGA